VSDFRKLVTAIGDAAGTNLKSATVWAESELEWLVGGGDRVPPAFSAHLILDGSEYSVALVPTHGSVTDKGHAPETS